MAKRGDIWFKFFPRDWLDDTRSLTLEERGAYIDAIAMQMDRGGALPEDYGWLAHQMHISTRKAKAIVESLIDEVKLRRTEGGLTNDRCEKELAARESQRSVNTITALAREHSKREPSVKHSRAERETSAKIPDARSDNVENTNTTNGNDEISCHETSTTRDRARPQPDIEKENKKKDNAPLPPNGGEAGSDLNLPLEGGLTPAAANAQKRRAAREAEAAMQRACREGVELFNKAAAHWGFTACAEGAMTEQRLKRLGKRLNDIGGLENFRKALRAIGKDDFLMGKVVKPGRKPFRLNFDRLLSTDSEMGDVLARLIDEAAPSDPVGPDGERWGWWRGKEANFRKLSEEAWDAIIADAKPNGTWPWWKLAAPPGHAECLVHPKVLERRKLVEVYRGEITHV